MKDKEKIGAADLIWSQRLQLFDLTLSTVALGGEEYVLTRLFMRPLF